MYGCMNERQIKVDPCCYYLFLLLLAIVHDTVYGNLFKLAKI